MRCEDLALLLPAAADPSAQPSSGGLDRAARLHIESCLRCQAELARYRRMLRALQLLRTRYLEPTPDLLAQTLAALEEAGERRAGHSVLTGKRLAYAGAVGGAAVAAGAAVTAVVLARSRRRQVRLAG